MTESLVTIFGIRHHGPGCARSLLEALEALQPDAILVEGPPDAEDVLPLLTRTEMTPPVALLVYAPENPNLAVYYPFAVFSPEWQALYFGLTRKIPVRFMDLPQTHQLALREIPTPNSQTPNQTETPQSPIPNPNAAAPSVEGETAQSKIADDPIGHLAAAAGYNDGERWWEQLVEQRRDSADLFAAILEAMTALRGAWSNERPATNDKRQAANDELREAFMRQTIRAAQAEGHQRIAVVCGAWHGPALVLDADGAPDAQADAALLKDLPRIKVDATWTPWTYGRLTFASGYGAGIESPGWYQHLWDMRAAKSQIPNRNSQLANRNSQISTSDLQLPITHYPTYVTIRWMTRVAQLLRGEDLEASAASVIEAVRLAESLAALRERPLPALPELNEAAQTVFCFGNETPLRLIHEKLIVGEVLGAVPSDTPLAPLQRDLAQTQKRLRLSPEASQSTRDFDLRNPTDLERSHLLHRLKLLGVPWGELQRAGGAKKGTFHEFWKLQWQPEFAIKLIERSSWGNTLHEATTALVRDHANKARDLPTLTRLVDDALLADLPAAVAHLMERAQAEAALASDVAHLMEALPPLANVLRYGNVRQTDTRMISQVVDGVVARICIGLPNACASLNDDAAKEMCERVMAVHHAIGVLQYAEYDEEWQATLQVLSEQKGLHGLLAGRCNRLLFDAGRVSADEAARRLSLALSTANEPLQAAAWFEGFLQGSGQLLLHDDALWQVVDSWVSALAGETFITLLPLLRRTFASFTPPERRMMGERVRREMGNGRQERGDGRRELVGEFDAARAERVLPLVAQLLGVKR
jgi:hypothetical protein